MIIRVNPYNQPSSYSILQFQLWYILGLSIALKSDSAIDRVLHPLIIDVIRISLVLQKSLKIRCISFIEQPWVFMENNLSY